MEAAVCAIFVEELVARIADDMRAHALRWSDFPQLVTEHIAFSRRMNAVMAERGTGRVNFPSCIKRFVKERLPEYRFRDRRGDETWFVRCLSENTNVLLCFEKIHMSGLGKTFTVKLGVEFPELGIETSGYSLFNCFDRDGLFWTYGHQDDLMSGLDQAQVLLRLVLPEFEERCAEFGRTGESELVDGRTARGALTFREAPLHAIDCTGPFICGFSQIDGAWLRSHPDSRRGERDRLRAQSTGRLGMSQAWRIRFVDPRIYRTITVSVPYEGRLRFQLGEELMVLRRNSHCFVHSSVEPTLLTLPVDSECNDAALRDLRRNIAKFVDSPEAMQAAEAGGGADFRRNNPDCNVFLQLNAEIADPPGPTGLEQWWVQYVSRAQPPCPSLHQLVSAFGSVTGSSVETRRQ